MSATRENPLADTPLDSSQPHHPGPTPSFQPIRHSRKGGNPGMSATRESHRLIRLWIPASPVIPGQPQRSVRPSFPQRRESRNICDQRKPPADTPLDSCPPRHSREGGNPGMSATRESHRLIRLWIPASPIIPGQPRRFGQSVIPANAGIQECLRQEKATSRYAFGFQPAPSFPRRRESKNVCDKGRPPDNMPLDSSPPRHSREGGNPGMSAARESHRPIRLWIPARPVIPAKAGIQECLRQGKATG